MPKLVTPKTFLIGYTSIDCSGLHDYLEHTGQESFYDEVTAARSTPYEVAVGDGEILCSFYAKLCYKALTETKNQNISKVRSIPDNIAATLKAGHGSVFEHVWLNFVTTNCSRVFTHELVRHRVGTAFSQTSDRYVRSDELEMVLGDPVLDTKIIQFPNAIPGAKQEWNTIRECLGGMASLTEHCYKEVVRAIDWNKMDFTQKKKLTSALRRILPNGQANEIGWSANVRALRHLITLRTARFAEWEIRTVFAEVFELCRGKWPLLFADAKVEMVDGLPEVTGMFTQPY